MKNIVGMTIFILLISSCEEKIENEPSDSNKFIECLDLLHSCNNVGDYCLFGMKWGLGNDFSNSGVDVQGPKIAGGTVSFSFQEKPKLVSNNRQMDVPTESFTELPSCAKEKVRNAFIEWSSVANIQFEETPEDSESDIKIFVASVTTCGNGFPNLISDPCQELAGHIILSPNYTMDCEIFYAYTLHEIGHCLGLGHAGGENLMGSINTNLGGLREGDIEGIRQIYGE